MTVTDVHGCYCAVKEEFRSVKSCKRRLKCPMFDFCMVDAFGTLDYDEGKYNRKRLLYEQLKLDI